MNANENGCPATKIVVTVEEFGTRGFYLATAACGEASCTCGLKKLLAVSVRSRTPFLDVARKLLAAGHRPTVQIEMRHRSSAVPALTSTIGQAAKLVVKSAGNGQPIFAPFHAPKPKRREVQRGRIRAWRASDAVSASGSRNGAPVSSLHLGPQTAASAVDRTPLRKAA